MKFDLKLNRDIFRIIIFFIIVITLIISYEAFSIEKEHAEQVKTYRQVLFNSYDDSIKREVQTVISQVEAYYERYQQGILTEEEAKELAKNVIRDARYGDDKSGLFWADTFDGKFIASGTGGNTPEGADRTGVTNAKGNYFVRTFIENAKKPEGGYSEYYYPRPLDVDPTQTPLPKRSYTAGFTPWQWAIGTGNYVDDLEALVAEYEAELNAKKTKDILSSILTYLFLLILTINTSLYINYRIAKRIDPMAETAREVAQGNLKIPPIPEDGVDSIGRLGSDLNRMVTQLKELVKETKLAAESVALTAKEMSLGMEQSALTSDQIVTSISQVADGTQQQDALVAKATDAVNDVTSTIANMIDNSQQMASKSSEVALSAQTGDEKIQRTINQMNNIEETVSRSAVVVEKLGERIKEISVIIDTISNIASQTNLLALNAAIEAARAGENGRGFAVVADEVSKLAEQAGEATEKIAELINAIQAEAQEAVHTMKEGLNEVKTGSSVVDEAGRSFKEITELVGEVSSAIDETVKQIELTAEANQQVEKAIKEVNTIAKNISVETSQISAATQEQSASIEEIAVSSDTLAHMADNLKKLVANFDV